MTAPRVEPTVESIEHLDFAPPCGMSHGKCDNPADYVAAFSCGCGILICSPCVARKASEVSLTGSWFDPACGTRIKAGSWLDFVTLHPLKAL